MISASHLGYAVDETSNVTAYWVVALLIILGIQANAMWGKTGPITTIKGVVTSGFILTVVFIVLNTVTI